MNTFAATIDRIYEVVISASVWCVERCIAFFSPATPKENVAPTEVASPDSDHESETPTFKAINEIIETTTPRIEKNTVMYAQSVRVPVYKNPTIEYDAQIGEVPYGEMVIVLEPKGRFYHIMWGTTEGWVLREDIADRAMRVHPEFAIGKENTVDHPNTAHVRAIIGDAFGLAQSEFPLQAGEYVLYKLWKRGKRIAWPEARPRVPGVWHKILRGVQNIHVGVVPKREAIMEYMIEQDVGHVAYVEAVYPDDTITISEANYPDSGTYNERELTKDEWKNLKPLFIHVQ